MNNTHGLTAENLTRTFPEALQGDEKMVALAQSIATILEGRVGEIAGMLLYSRIDELPEGVLDILAHDFKVDWYDPDYAIEQKRQTLKDSWNVHRRLGTKAAVLAAICAIYPDTKVMEAWEYGGDPYHFRLLIDSTFEGVNPERHKRVMDKVNFYKPLRSVLDETEYYDAGATATVYGGAACIGEEIEDAATAFRY